MQQRIGALEFKLALLPLYLVHLLLREPLISLQCRTQQLGVFVFKYCAIIYQSYLRTLNYTDSISCLGHRSRSTLSPNWSSCFTHSCIGGDDGEGRLSAVSTGGVMNVVESVTLEAFSASSLLKPEDSCLVSTKTRHLCSLVLRVQMNRFYF